MARRIPKNRRKKALGNQHVTVKPDDIKQFQTEAYGKAIDVTILLSLLVLRNNGYGQKRLGKFLDDYNQAISDFNNDRFSLTDVRKMLIDEVDITINMR